MINPIRTSSAFTDNEPRLAHEEILQRFHFPEQLIQWPKKQSMMQKVFDHRVLIEASPGLIWDYLTIPSLIPLWNHDIAKVSLNEKPALKAVGSHTAKIADMTGKLRILFVMVQRGIIQTQLITDWHPSESLGYTSLAGYQIGPHSVDLHIGLFKLTKQPVGTMVQWLNYLEFNENHDGLALLNALAVKIEEHLIRLKTQAENAHILSPTGC